MTAGSPRPALPPKLKTKVCPEEKEGRRGRGGLVIGLPWLQSQRKEESRPLRCWPVREQWEGVWDSTSCSFHEPHTTQLVSLAASFSFLLIPMGSSPMQTGREGAIPITSPALSSQWAHAPFLNFGWIRIVPKKNLYGKRHRVEDRWGRILWGVRRPPQIWQIESGL